MHHKRRPLLLLSAMTIAASLSPPAATADSWNYEPGAKAIRFDASAKSLHAATIVPMVDPQRAGAMNFMLTVDLSSSSLIYSATQVAFANDRTGRTGGWVFYDLDERRCDALACSQYLKNSNRLFASIRFADIGSLRDGAKRSHLVFRLRVKHGDNTTISYYYMPLAGLAAALDRLAAESGPAARHKAAPAHDSGKEGSAASRDTAAPQAHTALAYPRIAIRRADRAAIPANLMRLLYELDHAAAKRDLGGVLKHVGPAFFWDRDHGGSYDSKRSPGNNLLQALGLGPDTSPEYLPQQWNALREKLRALYASTRSEGGASICLPGRIAPVDEKLAQRVAKSFKSEFYLDWQAALGPKPLTRSPDASAPVVATLRNEAVRVIDTSYDNPDNPWLLVESSAGLRGHIRASQLTGFLDARLCFDRDAADQWRISGWIGGGD